MLQGFIRARQIPAGTRQRGDRRHLARLAVLVIVGLSTPWARTWAACLGTGSGALAELETTAFRDPVAALADIDRNLMARRAEWTPTQVATLDAIAGEAHRQLDHTLAALAAANDGLQLLHAPLTTPLAIRLRALHALMIDANGQTTEALGELTQALAEVADQPRALACLRKDRGFLLNTIGDTAGAFNDLAAAYEYLKENGPIEEAMVAAGRLASVYRSAGALDDAAALVNETINYFTSVHAWVRVATARERLGLVLLAQHEIDKALVQFEQMRRVSLLTGDVGGAAYADLRLCQAHVEAHAFSAALGECQAAERVLKSLGTMESFDRASLAAQFGRIALGTGDVRGGLRELTAAIATHAPELNGAFGAEIYHSRSEAYARLGQARAAYADALEYAHRLAAIGELDAAQQIALSQARVAIDRERARGVGLRRDHEELVERTSREQREKRFEVAALIGGALALLTIVAILQQRRMAYSARRAAERRLDELGRLTAGVAHDFNNLMTVVQQAAGLLSHRTAMAPDAESASLLRAIRAAAQTGGEITTQLLAFGRQQHLHPESIVLCDFLVSERGLFEQVVGPGIALSTELPADSPCIRADRAQLTTALVNLLLNARDAMAGRGRVILSVKNAPGGAGAAKLVGVSVADTGTGMPTAVLERATEPFFTTKEPGRGTGLGLSAVDGFVRQSGGRLEIRSVPGQGSCVTLWLPEPVLA